MAAPSLKQAEGDRSLPLKESSLALPNNLAVLPLPRGKRGAAYFASVHGPTVNVVSVPGEEERDGGPPAATCAHRQLYAKEGGHGLGLGAALITQVSSSSSSSSLTGPLAPGPQNLRLQKEDLVCSPPSSLSSQATWCVLPSRVLLVLTSRKGVQMYEADGSVMVYWHALEGMEASSPGKAAFARGVAATGQRFVCVGTSSGAVLVFDVPSKGTNITLSEVLEQHANSITDIGAELCEKPLWNGVIAAGYGDGQIRLFEASSGTLRAEVSAHARWIYALDLAPLSGKVSCKVRSRRSGGEASPEQPGLSLLFPISSPQLLSAGEDSFVQVWRLSHNPDTEAIEIEHCHGECVTDTLLCGARFCNPEGSAFAVTGFELSEIIRYVQV
ncbi:hypothetical protein JD844_025967 [Phrynosoma platyrhinos]|uniref:WD repeat-containing protein 54 beta-propeller domain-containing protein n=1 Tax=Phrynosoma platyrhinos TaxID=52577 RepID=A0ABQ7SEH5_PHRPL|nr:hypothetical protein JD844_025967 [Phrynosoma platyrhinos]